MIINSNYKIINQYKDTDLGLFRRIDNKNDTSFYNYLTDAIHKTNELQKTSEIFSIKLAAGELENIHEAMIVSQKAEISLQFMMEVRNKVLDAYREIMRMQI